MIKKRLGNAINIGSFTISPVEQLCITSNRNSNSVSFYVVQEPLGVVIESDGVQWAIDIFGKQVPVTDLVSSDE